MRERVVCSHCIRSASRSFATSAARLNGREGCRFGESGLSARFDVPTGLCKLVFEQPSELEDVDVLSPDFFARFGGGKWTWRVPVFDVVPEQVVEVG